MSEIVSSAVEYVKEFFKEDASGHDFYHTYRVYQLAMTLAENEVCDREIVALAALLHDVDDVKLVKQNAEPYHNAKEFLRGFSYPEERVNWIIEAISQISYKGKDSVIPESMEGKIVQDADRLDAIGAIGIARTFAYGGSRGNPMHIPEMQYRENMSAEEYHSHRGSTINHFYEKLLLLKDSMNTASAKQMAEHRHQYMEEFLTEFYEEWDGRK